MSGRNNRVVRNRERSSQFGENSNVLKIIRNVFLIAAVVGVLVFGIGKWKAKKQKPDLVEMETTLVYEYFALSGEKGVGVVNKNGENVLEAKYERN